MEMEMEMEVRRSRGGCVRFSSSAARLPLCALRLLWWGTKWGIDLARARRNVGLVMRPLVGRQSHIRPSMPSSRWASSIQAHQRV
uniref:Uncharacterized protein n=1 Tax=Oryza rufipogon TaxID=4529 RepID=A0A0E0QDN3_ORYRU